MTFSLKAKKNNVGKPLRWNNSKGFWLMSKLAGRLVSNSSSD
jgi:hypothetical protein